MSEHNLENFQNLPKEEKKFCKASLFRCNQKQQTHIQIFAEVFKHRQKYEALFTDGHITRMTDKKLAEEAKRIDEAIG